MSDGQSQEKYLKSRSQSLKSCFDKIYSTTWKKIEGDYEITTTVDYKGNHTIVREKIKEG